MKVNKKISTIALFLVSVSILGGCQDTPDKSSVVSKANGLSPEVIAEPLKKGELRAFDLPKQWKAKEQRSNDRVILTADIPVQPITTGNLPVLEIQNHILSQKELEELVNYFASNEILYIPNVHTKDVYQQVKKRIANKEGAFAEPPLLTSYQEDALRLEKAIELAPEVQSEKQKADVKFQKKYDDESVYVATDSEIPAKNNMDLFFSADVGDDREAHMEAEQYNSKAGNISKFSWETDVTTISETDLQFFFEHNQGNLAHNNASGYYTEWQNILNQLQAAINQGKLDLHIGQKRAEQVLKELNIQDMVLLSAQKTLWFPNGSIPKGVDSFWFDQIWQADPNHAKAGYQYTFTRTVEGVSIDQMQGSYSWNKMEDNYVPPFNVEKITIVVTEDGVKLFSWDGLCEEVSTIADNTNLLPFKEIEKNLFNQIYYYYAGLGQPEESKTKFLFEVSSYKLGYTYVTAYEKPNNAWLIPTWFFDISVGIDDTEETGKEYDKQSLQFMINALDGGLIGKSR